MEVPQGVTVMIDAGALFKLREARIGVGSSTASVDRSAGALQVLGTPEQNVFFTSYDDRNTGVNTNTVLTTPQQGNWGGIVFREDIDRSRGRFSYDRQGIFLNYVNHADMKYGGGNVRIDVSWNEGTTWRSVVASTPNDGSESFSIYGPATRHARIRVVSLSDTAVSDSSVSNISIR